MTWAEWGVQEEDWERVLTWVARQSAAVADERIQLTGVCSAVTSGARVETTDVARANADVGAHSKASYCGQQQSVVLEVSLIARWDSFLGTSAERRASSGVAWVRQSVWA